MQYIELIAVQGFFHRIDNDIHVVSGKILGNLVACTNTAPISLHKVRRAPQYIQVMNCHAPFLCIYTNSKPDSRSKQYPFYPGIYGVYQRFPGFIAFTFLNETDFRSRYAVVFNQLAFNFAIYIPSIAWLISTQIRKNKLCSFLCIVLVVIFCNHFGTMGSLVVGMVFIVRIY